MAHPFYHPNLRVWTAAVATVAIACVVLPLFAASVGAEQSYEINVLAYPDLVGDGPVPEGCEGCDAEFSTGDAISGRLSPVPELEIVLRDADGEALQRSMTTGDMDGRQELSFEVAEAANYTVEIGALPEGWALCPEASARQELEESDFSVADRTAEIDYALWQPCEAVAEAEDEDEDAEAPEAEDEAPPTSEPPTAEPTLTATLEVTATREPEVTAVPPATSTPEPEEEEEWTGAILGLVYVDGDENGALGPDEPGLAGVVVQLAGDDFATWQSTDEQGGYAFRQLPPGAYEVYIEQPGGYRPTTNSRISNVRVDGEIVAGIDFGMAPAEAATELPEETEVLPTAVPTPVPTPALAFPQTGVLPESSGRVLLGLATLVGALGLLGLALEHGRARRS